MTMTDPGRWADDDALAAAEATWADLLDAWGAWYVGHHRGAPVEPGVDEAELARRLVAHRQAFAARLVGIDAARLGAEDHRALEGMLAALPELDETAEPLANAGLRRSPGDGPPEPAGVAALRRRTFQAWGDAMAELPFGEGTLDRLTILSRLAREPDPNVRRGLFVALEPGWRILEEAYPRLLASSAARWAREGSPIEANAAALGLDPTTIEETLRRIVRAYRQLAMPHELVEPWEYRYATGGLARRLDGAIPVGRLRPINDAHLRSLGADPEGLRITYDIEPRDGRPVIPVAFCVGYDTPRRTVEGWQASRPWVFATYTDGGIGNLEELIHESGHALQVAATRTRPAFAFAPPDQAAFIEAIADVVGWSTHEPGFLAEQLGVAASDRESITARYQGVALDACWALFELEVHRHPDRDANEVWAEVMEADLGVRGHPEWASWAIRGQLIDLPGYLANYAIGAVMVAAVRGRITELRGDWSRGDPGWFDLVAEGLLQFGGSRTPKQVLDDFLGEPLTDRAILADIERGG